MPVPRSLSSPRTRLVVASLFVLVGLAYNLGGYPLLEPDEGRNAEVAREMAASNDYVLPTLNGLPYLDKPILYFGAVAMAFELGGRSATTARVASLIFTLLTLTIVWWSGERIAGKGAGWVAALATGSMPLTIGFARTVIFDAALTFFVVLSITALYSAIVGDDERDGRERHYWWTVTAWIAVGFGVLTKGPVAIAVPLFATIPLAVYRKRLKRMVNSVAFLSFVAILLPWIAAMSRRVPGFLEYALVTETFVRLTTDQMQRTGPFWYFVPILVAGALPWSITAIAGIRDSMRSGSLPREKLIFLAGWIVAPLIFFSLSQSKRPQYILPLMPAVALLVATMWSDGRIRGRRTTAAALAILGLLFAAAGGLLGSTFGAVGDVAAAIPTVGIGLGVACLIAATATWFARNRAFATMAMVLPAAAIPLVSVGLMNALGDQRSTARMAVAINAARTPQTEIIAIETFPLSLPFYLDTTLTLATSNGAELTSNYLFRTLDRWRVDPESTLRPAAWWRERAAVCDRPRIFIVKRNDDEARALLQTVLPLLGVSRKVVAYGPCTVRQFATLPLSPFP